MRVNLSAPAAVLRRHLPARTVRVRLSLVYAGLFMLLGTGLLLVTVVLWGRATTGHVRIAADVPTRILRIAAPATVIHLGSGTLSKSAHPVVMSKPPGLSLLSPAEALSRLHQVGTQLQLVAGNLRTSDLHLLVWYAGIVLLISGVIALLVGWIAAGRILEPLRTITTAAREISASNLHERLALEGPNDEIKVLGDTIDDLLARLERSFEAQRRFVANASHELRTPLATMRAALDVATGKPQPPPVETTRLAERLYGELDQVDHLLESFLALARSQRPGIDDAAPVSLQQLAAAALEAHAGAILERALEVRESDGEEALVTGETTLLARMVSNLVDNAVRHNKDHGWLRVRTEADGRTARLVVDNSGVVLDDAAVAELAQPFRRLGRERTASRDGLGLGLSIVAAIAEAHGGQLLLRPLDGGGLHAVVELPRAGTRAAPRTPTPWTLGGPNSADL